MGAAIRRRASRADAPARGADDHIFTDSKASWHDITDALPQFKEGPGG